MTDLGILVGLFGLIYISATKVEYYTLRTLLKLTRSREFSIRIFAVLFLPGTLVHEMCHALMAQLLAVRSSGMELMPKIDRDHIVMGEVGIESTDVFRRALIGAAPFLFGFPIVAVLVYTMTMAPLVWWQYLLIVYLIFQITNASFSSSKDMEGSFIVLLLVISILATLSLIGVPLGVVFKSMIDPLINSGRLQDLNMLLCLPLAVNLGVWAVGKWISR